MIDADPSARNSTFHERVNTKKLNDDGSDYGARINEFSLYFSFVLRQRAR